jgi:hypothetical protein
MHYVHGANPRNEHYRILRSGQGRSAMTRTSGDGVLKDVLMLFYMALLVPTRYSATYSRYRLNIIGHHLLLTHDKTKAMLASSSVFIALAAIGCVNAQGSLASWHPAGPLDCTYIIMNLFLDTRYQLLVARGPCPMLNTLANHGYLPHEGRDFTLPIVKHALRTGLNVSEDISEMLFNFALTTNTAPNATTWGLDTLGHHNVLEHDASLRSARLLGACFKILAAIRSSLEHIANMRPFL